MTSNDKIKRKKINFLTKFSIILFLIGLVCFFVGIFYAFEMVSENAMKMVYDDFEDMFVMSDFSNVIMCFFTGFVFFVWGGVLLIISRISAAKRQKEQEEQETEQKIESVPAIQEAPKKIIYCAYCETELSEHERSCPNCGSSKKKIKQKDS